MMSSTSKFLEDSIILEEYVEEEEYQAQPPSETEDKKPLTTDEKFETLAKAYNMVLKVLREHNTAIDSIPRMNCGPGNYDVTLDEHQQAADGFIQTGEAYIKLLTEDDE